MPNRFSVGILLIALALSACKKGEDKGATNSPPAVDGNELVAHYRAMDTSRDSSMKIRAKISDTSSDSGSASVIEMNMYRKRGSDGGQIILVEFISPDEERDRAAIVKVGPGGEIEATRYVQSNDTFISADDVRSEDSLFGITLQEIVDGQTEKYDFRATGEETIGGATIYRLEGTLKAPAQSKFPRLLLLVSKENNLIKGAEFYDTQNNLARRLMVETTEQVAGHWTRMQWTIYNLARQKRIDFETLEAKYDQQLSDSFFSQERLKKLATK